MLTRVAVSVVVTALCAAVVAGHAPQTLAASSGAVFSMSNGGTKNKVLTWAANGSLSLVGSKATGGRGTGGQLNNQGGLALTEDGKWLYVANAGGDSLSVFRVDSTTLTRTDVEPSLGDKPISVAVKGSLVYVNPSGTPVVVSAAVATTETAACWMAVTPDGKYAYVTNTPDHSISGFAVGANGSLMLLDADGRTAATGSGSFPIDLDTSSNGDYLYVLAAGTHRILVYAIAANGSLVSRPGVGGLPGAANGLVAR